MEQNIITIIINTSYVWYMKQINYKCPLRVDRFKPFSKVRLHISSPRFHPRRPVLVLPAIHSRVQFHRHPSARGILQAVNYRWQMTSVNRSVGDGVRVEEKEGPGTTLYPVNRESRSRPHHYHRRSCCPDPKDHRYRSHYHYIRPLDHPPFPM